MNEKATRVKKSFTEVPTSLEQANMVMQELGQAQSRINEIDAELKAKIKALKDEAWAKIAPLVAKRDRSLNALFAYAHPIKTKLLERRRTVDLGAGKLGWRLTPPRVDLARDEQETIAVLRNTGHEDFIRVVEEVNRERLLQYRPVVAGITYCQSDEFFAVPSVEFGRRKTITKAIDK